MSTERADAPVYLTQAAVARKLGVGRAAVANYTKRYPDEAPKPAAYLEQEGREFVPLWQSEQMSAWLALRLRRSGPELRSLISSLDEQAQAAGLGSIAELLTATSSPQESSNSDPGPTPDA